MTDHPEWRLNMSEGLLRKRFFTFPEMKTSEFALATLSVADALELGNVPEPVSQVLQAWREWCASSNVIGLITAEKYLAGGLDHLFAGSDAGLFATFLNERGLLKDGVM